MADNQIAYKIVVDTSKAVAEIKDLEQQIGILKKELSNTKDGTVGFETLEAAITGLEKKYDTLIQTAIKSGDIITTNAKESAEAIKGVNTEADKTESGLKKLGDTSKKVDISRPFKEYVKIGSAITSSFAAAQSIYTVFGAESEQIAEAAAKAQGLLTVAIAAREVAEAVGIVTTNSATVATEGNAVATTTATVATEVNTAANAAQISVLQRLYALILANPYIALAAAIGAVITAFAVFTTGADKATKAQKEFQKNINIDVAKETTNLKILVSTIEDTTQSIDTRKQALEELQKKFPKYFENLKNEDILSGNVKIRTDELTKSIVAQAQARALEQRIGERAVTLLDLEERRTAATNERISAEKNLAFVQRNAASFGQGAPAAIQGASGRLRNAIEQEIKLKNELNDLNVANAQDIAKILELTKESTSTLKVDTGVKEDNNKATKEQIMLANQLEAALNSQITSLEKTAEIFKKLADAGGFDIAEPEALKRVKELKNNIEGLIPKDLKDKFKSIGLDIAIENGTFKIKEFGNELKNVQDFFGEFVERVRVGLTQGILVDSIEDFTQKITLLLNEASLKFQAGIITEGELAQTQKLLNLYKDLSFIINALPKGVENILTPESLQSLLDVTRKIAIATGEIKYDKVNGEIVKVKNSTIILSSQTEQLTKITEDLITKLTEAYKKQTELNGGGVDAFRKQVEQLLIAGKITQEQADALIIKSQEVGIELPKLYQELGKAQVEALQNTIKNIVAAESEVREFLFQLAQERNEALKLQTEGQKQLLLNNLEDVFKITQAQNKVIIDDTKTTEEQVASLKQQYADKKIDLTNFTEEEILKIVTFYLEKQKDAEAKALTDRQKNINKILEGIQLFQQTLNSLSQTTTAYYNAQFDTLEKRYKRIQDGILEGDIDVSKKRLEAEKIYNAEKTKLEKQSAKVALSISLAQAIANTAEAITKLSAITGGIGAVIAGTAVAAFNAVQVGIIANQLATINKYRGGGRIKMAGGGLVEGAPHEYGGVKFQGGGIELEGNEAVINRFSTVNFMGLLDQINQAGGGKPIGNFDDSRIVEAIAKQRNTPIRAYVVESDITAKQQTARKLEQLAQI